MSYLPSMPLALSTNLRAFFTYPCIISIQKAFQSDCFLLLTDLLVLVWIASHSEIVLVAFHVSTIPFFCSSIWHVLFFYLSDGFWHISGRNTCNMWIATGSHFLLQLKGPIRWDILAISVFPAFPLGIYKQFFSILQFCHMPNWDISDFFDVFHLAPHYRHFFLGISLILILATMA